MGKNAGGWVKGTEEERDRVAWVMREKKEQAIKTS